MKGSETTPLDQLQLSAVEVSELESAIEVIEGELRMLKKRKQTLLTSVMPDLMGELDMNEISLKNGKKFKLTPYVDGVFPKDKNAAEEARRILTMAGAQDLIKSKLTANFGRSEYANGLIALGKVKEVCPDAKLDTTVHVMSLRAFGRKCLTNGSNIDLSKLGLRVGNIVKIFKK